MQEFSHMAWMGVDAEFLLENVGQDGRGPNAGVEAVRHRAALHDVVELLLLCFGEFARASAPVPFLDPLQAILIPAAHPRVDAAAVNMKQISNLGWGMAIHAEQEGLQTQSDPGGPVALSGLAQSQ
jgi:hypothetical protein